MEDTYIVTMIEQYICYFKNGLLHRELGPAVYLKEDKEEYENSLDKALYKPSILESNIEMLFLFFDFSVQKSPPYYYLNGDLYDKEIFNAIIEKQEIKKELSTELLGSQNIIKRTKL
jgi:hypothetical protein